MFEYSDYKIILCCGVTDMRKSINALLEILFEQFQLDPRNKIIFAFFNNSINHIKLLVLVDNGFWIHFKRIERGRIVWPTEEADEKTMILTYNDLKNIIIASEITQKIKRTKVWKKC